MRKLNSCFSTHWPLSILLLTCISFAAPAYADERYDDDHPDVEFAGNWQVVTSSEASGGTVRASDVAGASATLMFTGTNITWFGYRCACAAGIARVYLDGELDATIDTYAAVTEAYSEIYQVGGLADTTHTLRIEVTGERNSAGESAYVVVDEFYSKGGGVDMLQEDNFAIDYTGTWTPVSEAEAHGGGGVIAQTAGATATLHFTGTGVRWIGYRCACAAGIARVLLDGALVATVNGNLPDPADHEAQAVMYAVQNLPLREHTLRIEITGTSAAQSTWVALDGFMVDSFPRTPQSGVPLTGLDAPVPWALVTGMVTLRAYAQDDLYTTKVQFFANDELIGEDLTRPYAITRDTSGIPSGSRYRLTVRAFDADGNVGTSQPIWATVQHEEPEHIAPTLSVTAPAAGSTVSGTISIVPVTSDASGIAWVGSSVDNPYWIYPSADTEPFVHTLNTLDLLDGAHELHVQAMDFMRNLSTVVTVPIIVDNRVQPGMVRLDEEDPAIVYSNGWGPRGTNGTAPATMFNWGDYVSATAIGSTATLTFDGVGVRWIGKRCDLCGDASVSIDGGPAQQVGLWGDEWGRPGNIATVVYTSPVLANGSHTLTVTVIDANASNPTTYPVVIDGFEVLK